MRRHDNAIEKHPDLVSYCFDFILRRDHQRVCLVNKDYYFSNSEIEDMINKIKDKGIVDKK